MTNWSKKSTYHVDTKDGRLHISGQLVAHNCQFRFGVNEMLTGNHPYRGYVELISPADGMVLQIEGPRRREVLEKATEAMKAAVANGKRVPKLDAKHEIYLTSADDNIVKAKIYATAEKLYAENLSTLKRSWKIKPTVELICIHWKRTNCSKPNFFASASRSKMKL